MPRVGDVMQLLSGTLAVPNTTIQSAPYNAQQQDWVLEANAPRPITAGGTGSTTAAGARAALGAAGAGDLAAAATKAAVVDTDSVAIVDSEAANVPKRWLVSAMRTAFGPDSHDHTKLVSTTADVSLNLGGTPGAGTLRFNNKADGSGTNTVTISEAGALTLASDLTTGGSLTVGTSITAAGSIVANGGVIGAKATSGNVHLWLYGHDGGTRVILYTAATGGGHVYLVGPGGSWTFNNDGTFHSPSSVYAGSAYLYVNGDIGGNNDPSNIWTNWGAVNAFNAISLQIENRALAWANNRVAAMAGRKTDRQYNAGVGVQVAPAGAVMDGLNLVGGSTKEIYGFYFVYLQLYDPVRGWIGFQ